MKTNINDKALKLVLEMLKQYFGEFESNVYLYKEFKGLNFTEISNLVGLAPQRVGAVYKRIDQKINSTTFKTKHEYDCEIAILLEKINQLEVLCKSQNNKINKLLGEKSVVDRISVLEKRIIDKKKSLITDEEELERFKKLTQ